MALRVFSLRRSTAEHERQVPEAKKKERERPFSGPLVLEKETGQKKEELKISRKNQLASLSLNNTITFWKY